MVMFTVEKMSNLTLNQDILRVLPYVRFIEGEITIQNFSGGGWEGLPYH